MRESEYQNMFEVEDSHFWFKTVRQIVLELAKDLAERPLAVLDLGCGTGGTMSQMPPAWRVTGADYSAQALAFSRVRGHRKLARVDAQRLPLRDASFDLIFALDVVEHTERDDLSAAEIFRVLRPGGRFIASVPAYQALFGPHDEALGHHRRYRRSAFRRLLEGAGFEVQRATYFNSLLFPLAATVRVGQRLFGLGGESNAAAELGPLNGLFARVFAQERRLLGLVDLPVGLSVLAVARRPPG